MNNILAGPCVNRDIKVEEMLLPPLATRWKCFTLSTKMELNCAAHQKDSAVAAQTNKQPIQ